MVGGDYESGFCGYVINTKQDKKRNAEQAAEISFVVGLVSGHGRNSTSSFGSAWFLFYIIIIMFSS